MIKHVMFLAAMVGFVAATQGAEFHVTTAQELQNALTAAAANAEGDTVYVAAGYYIGNFNFNSAEAQSLTIQAESGVANHEITIDGAGTGRSMNLTATAAANITVRGLTVTRNCNNTLNAGLRLSTTGGDVLVENCRAIGVTSSKGIGIEIAAAKIATVRGCAITRDATSQGDGISVTGVTGSVTVEQNTVSGNTTLVGKGVYIYSAVPVSVCDNNISSNLENGILINYPRTATVAGNTVSGNKSSGIYISLEHNASGTTTLTGNTVSGNTARIFGGGIYVYNTGSVTATLTGNMVIGNTASAESSSYECWGGGIYVSNSSSGNTTLTGNTVSGNIVKSPSSYSGYGGGICVNNKYSSGTAATFLTGNTVSGNAVNNYSSGDTYGGGIYFTSGVSGTTTMTLKNNTVTGNLVTGNNGLGGGVYASGPTLKFLDNMITGNRQTAGNAGAGGGVWVKATTLLDMVNNTLTENAAAGIGGGAAFQVDGVTETLHVYNNIIWGNTADGNGDDVHVAGSGSRKEFMYNDAHDLYGVWDISEHNIDAAPLFYDAANQNYHLRSGSPCLNAGFNTAPSIPATDIDNEARITEVTVDMGADEMSNTDPHPADLNDDWVISEAEYTAYAAAWKNDQGWSRQPSPVPADYVTRAGYLKQQAGGAYRNDGGPKPVCWVPN